MVYYRGLFEDLLEDREHGAGTDRPIERPVSRAADIEGAEDRSVARAEDRPIRKDREVRP